MKIHTLGDTHLGKKFEAGVPLHRRGDREKMQFEDFVHDLMTPCDVHIQMGDLFDKFHVSFNVIWATAQAYITAKKANPNRTYALLRGNHDASRDLERVSAFQIFTGLVRPHGIIVADDQVVEVAPRHFLVPWHPVSTAEEMVQEWAEEIAGTEKIQGVWQGQIQSGATVYGHWDVVMGDENRIPAAQLKELGVELAVTGHDHNARELEIDGLTVRVTGSMQPYSHSEDAEESLYVTRSLADVLAAPDAYVDKCLRVILEADEVLDIPIDCLQLTIQRGKAEQQDIGEVDFEAFDLNSLFQQSCADVGLSDEISIEAKAKLEEERASRT